MPHAAGLGHDLRTSVALLRTSALSAEGLAGPPACPPAHQGFVFALNPSILGRLATCVAIGRVAMDGAGHIAAGPPGHLEAGWARKVGEAPTPKAPTPAQAVLTTKASAARARPKTLAISNFQLSSRTAYCGWVGSWQCRTSSTCEAMSDELRMRLRPACAHQPLGLPGPCREEGQSWWEGQSKRCTG